MGTYDSHCVGFYTGYYAINRQVFMEKIQQGMTAEEFFNEQKGTFKLYVATGVQNGKHPFSIYQYEVDGKTYYGTTKVGYSRDIHYGLKGKACKVYYMSSNPYISSPGDIDGDKSEDDTAPKNLLAFILALISSVLCGVPVLPIILGIVALFVSISAYKNQKSHNVFAIFGIVLSSIAILVGLISTIILVVMLIVWLINY
ncbi:MAG: hypothetical protein MJ094_04915 [Saccharofermentans sp.]|nr:hypothetical protein [Saccharofermentans sp.]